MGIDPEHWRDYLICTELHIPPHVADEMPAVKLDWLLAVHGAVTRVQNERNARAANG